MKKSLLIVVLLLCSMSLSNLIAQDIIKEVQSGNLKAIKSLVEKDVKLLQTKDAAGNSLLHLATAAQDIEIVKFLIDKGCDVNAKSNNMETPLHEAAKLVDKELTSLLISKGAVIDINNAANITPLSAAIYHYENGNVTEGRLEVVKLLIEKGGDINRRGMWNWLPIQVAAEFGSAEIIDYLIERGADIPIQQAEEAYQLLNASCRRALPNLFSRLLEKGFELQINRYTGNLIHMAAAGGSELIVEKLLAIGFKVMTGDGYGWSPLHSAAEAGKLKVVELLVNKGADINDRSASGLTPYNLAEKYGRKDVSDYLISKGADTSDQQFPILTGKYMGQKEPVNNMPSVFAPDIVTTKYMLHGNIIFSPDGSEAYWSTWAPTEDSEREKARIVTSKIIDGKWSIPSIAPFSKIGFDDDSPFVSPDGNKLFFLSRRPLIKGEANSTKENIWYMTREGSSWSEPKPLDIVNSLALHWHLSVDEKGNLFFGSRDPQDKNFGEIFCSKFVDGKYTNPEALSSKINSVSSEGSPFISPGGDYMIFERASNQGIPMGLYISFLLPDGSWSEARSITETAKISPQARGAYITHDGKYMFYVGYYSGETAAFWIQSDFIEAMRKSEVK